MNAKFVRRRSHHVGVCSDADQWQSHGRLTERARGPRQQRHGSRTTRHERQT